MGYARDILGITTLTADQQTILRSLLQSPRRVLVPSAHDVGKTFIAGVAVNWWYDSFDPGAVFSLGPRHDSLKDTLWAEVRLQRARAKVPLPDDFLGPSAPEMRSSPDHWGKGLTALKDASLTGRHLPHMLFVLEEACGIDPVFWLVVKTMFDASLGHAMLAIFNPTDTTSQAYQEDMACDDATGEPQWTRIRLSALDHPNIAAEREGRERPVRHAVSMEMVTGWVRDWCEPVEKADDRVAIDVEWPPESGQWYRPGPNFQARALGLWPDSGSGVWSPALWEAAVRPLDGPPVFPPSRTPEIGCDCSTGKGDDYFAWHGRWGIHSLAHETSNTMDAARIVGRLKEACQKMADVANARKGPHDRQLTAKEIPVKIDDDGTGGAVGAFLRKDGYLAVQVGAGCRASDPEKYPRKRDELWFASANKARAGLLNLSLLDRATRGRLRQQLLAPTWDVDAAGRRVVEPKDDTKTKIGRSPDDADALNLAYLEWSGGMTVVNEREEPAKPAGRTPKQRSPYNR